MKVSDGDNQDGSGNMNEKLAEQVLKLDPDRYSARSRSRPLKINANPLETGIYYPGDLLQD